MDKECSRSPGPGGCHAGILDASDIRQARDKQPRRAVGDFIVTNKWGERENNGEYVTERGGHRCNISPCPTCPIYINGLLPRLWSVYEPSCFSSCSRPGRRPRCNSTGDRQGAGKLSQPLQGPGLPGLEIPCRLLSIPNNRLMIGWWRLP